MDGHRPAVALHGHVGGTQDRIEEWAHVLAPADGGAHLLQLRRDLLGIQGVLGEARSACLLAVAGVVPLGMDRLHFRVEVVDEVEVELPRVHPRPLAEQRALEQCLGDLFAGPRHGNGYAKAALDALVLADEDIEDHAVDRVVPAVVGDHPHLGSSLAEAIHPAFALLVPRRVPREVVVEHRVEVVLEVDALGQAVGANENETAAFRGEGSDTRISFGRWQPAGDRLHPNVLGEGGAKVPGNVLRGIDEAAEDDRVEPVREKGLDLAHRALELAVVRGIEAFGSAGEREQPAPRRLTATFRFRAGAEVESHRVVIVSLVEDGAPPDLVDVLAFRRLVHRGPAPQGRGRGGGARRDAAQQRERRPVAHPPPALRRPPSSDTYSRAKARMSSKRARWPGLNEYVVSLSMRSGKVVSISR